jgi:starvation-inducible DNA-binding protein
MTITMEAVPDTARFTAAATMQKLLVELTALAMDAKQAHWNVTGPGFLPLHALTDEIAADARAWADRVAERAVALDFAVDARPRTVAAVAGVFPAGRVGDREAIEELVAVLERVARIARASLPELELSDPVGHDVTIEVLEGIEKHRWMLRAVAP